MNGKKKMILLLCFTAAITMIAAAGKLIAHKNTRHQMEKTAEMPSAKEEYAKLINKFMSPGASVGFSGSVNLYDGKTPSIVKEKSFFTYLRNGKDFYSVLSFQQTFFNGKFLVQVDSMHKLIFITASVDSNWEASANPMSMADKLFNDTAGFKVTGIVRGDDRQRSITITSDFNPEIQNFTVYYSPTDYSMKSAEVRFFKNGQRSDLDTRDQDNVWISKIDYRELPVKDLDVDGMISKIFLLRDHQIEPTPAYKNYRVIIK